MRKIFKRLSILICGCLIAVCALTTFASNIENVSTPVRDVELVKQDIDMNSDFEKFDSYDLEFDDGKVDFIGYDSIKLSDLYELDLLSDETVDNEVLTKYSCTYDYENGIVSLSVSLVSETETTIIDTIYGVVLMDSNENYDVAFDCDGEILLLSELEEAGILDNCGFFSKLKKVWNTTAGKIGTIATVATCAVVGIVCAVVPGGQLVTAACVGVAVGAIGGAVTAGVSTYISDGSVDWAAVGCYAGAGAVVGGAISAATYGVTTAIKSAIIKACDHAEINSIAKNATNICDANKQNHILQSKHAWSKICDGGWNNVSRLIQKTIVEGTAEESATAIGNILFTYKYNNEIIEVTGQIVNGVLKVVDAWVKTH